MFHTLLTGHGTASSVLMLSLNLVLHQGHFPSGSMLNFRIELHPMQRILVIYGTILLASMAFSSCWMLVAQVPHISSGVTEWIGVLALASLTSWRQLAAL